MKKPTNLLKYEKIAKLKSTLSKASDARCVGHFLKMLDLLAEGAGMESKGICKDAQTKIQAACGGYDERVADDKNLHENNKLALQKDIFVFWQVVTQTAIHLSKVVENDCEKDILHFLEAVVEKRIARLTQIEEVVHPQAMQYVPYYTHVSKENIGRLVLQCVDKFEIYENIKSKLFIKMTAKEITDCLEDMRQIVGDKYFGILSAEERLARQFELEALRGAFWHYNNNKQIDAFPTGHSYLAPNGFLYCEDCWRMCVKHPHATYAHCDLHNPLEKGQHTASRTKTVGDTLHLKKKLLPSGITQYLLRLQEVWKPKHKPQDENALLEILENIAKSSETIAELPFIEYDLSVLWELLPHVAHFLKEHGADLESPSSILNVLNPYSKEENTVQSRHLRKALHAFYERNFWFYRFELAFAELWLETYHTKFANVKHGGARKGSGGKRAGAGRKPKQK